MTEKANPSRNRPAEAFKTAGAIAYGGHGSGGFVVDGASPTDISTQDSGITEADLNAFDETSDGDSLDVTIDGGEAFVFGSWLAIDTDTTVSLDASTDGQTVYVGWNKDGTDDVIIGLDSAFSSATDDTDERIPLWTFDADGSGVTSVTDDRTIGQSIDVENASVGSAPSEDTDVLRQTDVAGDSLKNHGEFTSNFTIPVDGGTPSDVSYLLVGKDGEDEAAISGSFSLARNRWSGRLQLSSHKSSSNSDWRGSGIIVTGQQPSGSRRTDSFEPIEADYDGTRWFGFRFQSSSDGIPSNVQFTGFANERILNNIVLVTDDTLVSNATEVDSTDARSIVSGDFKFERDVLVDGSIKDDDGNKMLDNVATSGQVQLSDGLAEISTNVNATDATFMLALGIDDPNEDVEVAGSLFWDDSAGNYEIRIRETKTSVENPTVNYDVIRVR